MKEESLRQNLILNKNSFTFFYIYFVIIKTEILKLFAIEDIFLSRIVHEQI